MERKDLRTFMDLPSSCCELSGPPSVPRRGRTAVTTLEALHAACGVQDPRGPGVERMTRRRDLDIDQRVGAPVLPLDRLRRVRGRTGQKRDVRGPVTEDDGAGFGVDAGLHEVASLVTVDGSVTVDGL